MAKRYIVDLTKDEKEHLIELTCKGRPGARKIKRANMLLLAEANKTDVEIAKTFKPAYQRYCGPAGSLSMAD